MLHNKWPKVNRIEQPFIILTDSGSEFQTGHSRDGLSQFHDVWDPNLRTGRLWGPKSSAELFIHLSSLIGLGLNTPIGPLPMVSPHGLVWASSERGDQDPRVSVWRRKLGVSFIFFYDQLQKTHSVVFTVLCWSSISSGPCSREGNIEPTSQWKECQSHCNKKMWEGVDWLIDWLISIFGKYNLAHSSFNNVHK